VVCLLLLGLVWGCSSSTEPEVDPNPDPVIVFSPASQGQSLALSDSLEFSVSVRPAANLTVSWYLQGQVVGQDPVLTFLPSAVGKDTLQVSAVAGAVRDTFYWVIEVEEDVTAIPPEVSNVDAQPGPRPAEVEVTWIRVAGATFPLEEYLVAFSYDGPVTEENWDQATILGRYPPVPGQVGYTQIYNETEHDMRPGQEAWFAVRVRDDRQQLSPLTSSVRHDITWPWWLGGLVRDDAGLPLPVVGVSGGGVEDNTDGRGLFLFDEPYRNIDGIRVATSSSGQYNFHTPPFTVQQETTHVDITLINKYGLGDPSCYFGDFLEYLRIMTRTVEVPGVPAESLLYRWDQYPISVYIPSGVQNQAGVDMEAPCLAAMEFWNLTMRNDADLLGITETDYFVRTGDQASADIFFLFELRPQNYGEITLELPAGKELGEVVPVQMQIWINLVSDLDEFEEVQGVALHEFGHTLGLFNHSECPGAEYLMAIAGGAAAMRRLEPIHLDERRAIRAIRNLPQGTDMAEFTAGRVSEID
jgi:hypothetical protein